MDHSRRSMEGNCAENTVDSGGQAQEVSKGNDISNWATDHSCEILAKEVAAFCPCMKNLSKIKLKSFRLMYLTEENSRQPKIDSMMWLLVVTLMQVYSEKRAGRAKRIIKCTIWGENEHQKICCWSQGLC